MKTTHNPILRVRQWFKSPVFPEDEDKTRIAGMLHVILMVLLVALAAALLLAFSGAVSITNRTFFYISAVIGPGMVIAMLVLLRKGYVPFVAWSLVTFQWLSTMIQVIGSGGIQSPAIVAFVITILLAGFLVHERAAIGFAGLSVLSIWGAWWLESTGHLPHPLLFAFPQARLFFIMVMMAVSGALLDMVLRRLNQSISSSRARTQELEKVVREKIQAEEKVQKLNAELQQEVAEMERFTYTVSHDLRSPLVTIKGFLGMLEKDIQSNQTEHVQRDFQRISNATDQMQALLTDLLELSRIGRIVNPPEEIDLLRLTREVLIFIDSQIRDRHIQVRISDLPHVHADRIRMREVMQNLIENAAKYMGDQPTPVIEIGTRMQEGRPIVFVKDNGIGIEPQYHTRIFGLFEKLDPSIEGTGIGLAIVKRIIELHGGRLWVESEGLGKGSTFCFTIPDSRIAKLDQPA